MRTLVAALALLFSCAVQAQLPAGCSGDASLTGRTDVIWCEKFENSTWWEAVNGYTEDGGKTNPQPSSGPDRTQIISSGCVSGNCLQGNFPACVPDGESWSGVLGKNKVIPGNKDEIYLRYYIKLADNFGQPYYDKRVSVGGGCIVDAGGNTPAGKLPGLADVRTDADGNAPPPSTATLQCGNGGDASDGLWCWSARASFRNCTSGLSNEGGGLGSWICEASKDVDGDGDLDQPEVRFGWYWYLPGPDGALTNSQKFGLWDTWRTGTGSATSGDCTTDPYKLGNESLGSVPCGKSTGGNGGLVPNFWHLVEMYIKMNTPGSQNGISRGWLNGVLKYEKTNMEFRRVGHDNLHVRTVWLELYGGGENMAGLTATNAWLDELVVIDASGWAGNMALRPGPWKKPGAVYKP